ncbi:MAG: hypothetical protein GF408_02235 [Candidatus Omnitrophica bacterium]|nr:hypothetical protein [Candidatus Omnitrophota bacterium]
MSDKRKYMRFNVFLEAICRTGNGLMKKFKINNFSREGLGVESYDALPEGENLEIELMIPGDNMPIILEGELAWCAEERDRNTGHRGGIKLKKVSNSDRSKLLGYIYNKWITSGK